ncbi:MAG TPA: hypothetical protein VLT33_22045 [Labilithrix sp.]|nr:hypothetical protein [Labilithrix sp.]
MRPRGRWKTCVWAGAFLAASSGSRAALADDAPAAPPAPASAKPAASEEKMAEARRQFEAGVSLLEDPDGAKYEDAYRAFKRAYEISQSPKVLGNIAFCALHLERDGEAIDSYTSYLRDVPDISERERSQIQRDLATMMATMARIRVATKAPTKGAIVVDRRTQTRGQVVENAYALEGTDLVLRLRPGRHTLVVKTGATESAPFEATLEPGSELTFTPQEQAQRPQDTAPARGGGGSRSVAGPIIVGAIGLVGIGVGVATGLVARNKTDDIEKNCPNDKCPGTYDLAGARSSAKTFGTVADVSFIGGGALVGGAVIWYLLTPKEAAPGPVTGSSASWKSWRPSAMCTGNGCGFNVGGGF